VRGGDAQGVEPCTQCGAFHGTAIVGMQHQRMVSDAFAQHRPLDHGSAVGRRFTIEGLEACDLARVDVDDQVQVIEMASNASRQ